MRDSERVRDSERMRDSERSYCEKECTSGEGER